MGLLKNDHPSIAKEIDYTFTYNFSIDDVTSGSGKLIYWKCENGHSFPMSVRHKVYGRKCCYCFGTKVLPGFNDFATYHPELTKMWIDESVLPQEISKNSAQKVKWKCTTGHITSKRVIDISSGHLNCNECALVIRRTSKIAYGKNKAWIPLSTASFYKELAPGQKDVSQKSVWDKEKLIWNCNNGENHTYAATAANRNAGRNCPYCSGHKVLVGFNDLLTTHPHLASMLENSQDGIAYTRYSAVIVNWKCNKGHIFPKAIGRIKEKEIQCSFCANKKILIGFNDLATTHPHLIQEWNDERSIQSITFGSKYTAQWKCPEGHDYSLRLTERTDPQKLHGCTVCSQSTGEREMRLWIDSLGIDTVTNTRKIITPLELDIYIPHFNFALEYNGIYWHSKNKKNWYHQEKTDACKKQDIQLLHIWEDDWRDKKEIVKKTILRKLNLSSEKKIGARKTNISTVSKDDAKIFMSQNHIQGFKSSTVHLGLQYKQEIVAVLSAQYSTKYNIWKIERYATNCLVQGGFSKLLSYLKKQKPECHTITTFADQAISQGSLYEQTGFCIEDIIDPDYMYVVNGQRLHKFGYRISRFKNDDKLIYIEGKTETELSEINNLSRIWGCCKIKYVLRY